MSPNDWAKATIMDSVDGILELTSGITVDEWSALVTNRNRVAKTLGFPSKSFKMKKERVDAGRQEENQVIPALR